MSTLSIATTGLSAASTRLNVAARNVANVLTAGPLPATDGAAASSSASNLPVVYAPLQVNRGAAPDIDPAGAFVQMATAKYAFAANAKVMQATSDMTKSLLDITA